MKRIQELYYVCKIVANNVNEKYLIKAINYYIYSKKLRN